MLRLMSEVELHVVCKHCGAEVSPYITECPYCGKRVRKRAPKLESRGSELAPKESKSLFARFKRRPKATPTERPLGWLADVRPYGTIALLAATAGVYIVDRTGSLGFFGLGAVVGPVDGDFWRLIAAQFNYSNLGYLFAVGIATAIYGTILERRYNALIPVGIFLISGAAGMYLAAELETPVPFLLDLPDAIHVPIAIGGNGSALGLLCAWAVRERRDRRSGHDTESDLLLAGVIAVVVALMPLVDSFASWWVALGGAATGALIGLLLPARR